MAIATGQYTIIDLNDVDIATTPPLNPVEDQLWLDTSVVPNVLKRWGWIEDEEGWGWINASPTSPEDIGAETPDGAQEKADDAVDAVEVGGRNLITDSKERTIEAVNDWTYRAIYYGLARNTTYTISFEAEFLEGQSDYITVFPFLASGQALSRIHIPYSAGIRMSATFTTDDRYDYNLIIYAGKSGETAGNTVKFKKLKLERGNKPTDWTPAPEDVEAYAEHKAAEAQAAAEAVARAEAELAEAEAKAYADGVVSAEEQARIDDANAKLAEAKAYAETKSVEAQAAAQAYAEQKAQEAQTAAEAVARAEATLAQVNAEAYADGKVSAEEQARIDQAAANLAEAKTHAEAKAAEAEQAAKAYAETQIDNHDANPSPHNLPSYAKMESTGFKVYDDQGNLRTHMGQYAPGEFGNWVDAGHYMLRDKGMDMSLMQLPNMIPDHSFECLEGTGNIDATYNDFAIPATPYTAIDVISLWATGGSPRLISTKNTDIYPGESIFGLQNVVVNSSNWLEICIYCVPNTTYFVSGFTCRGYRNQTAGTPRLYFKFYNNGGVYPAQPVYLSDFGQNFTPYTDRIFHWKRVGCAVTTPADCFIMTIRVTSADANYVCWDGMQTVEGTKPTKYDPEDGFFSHAYGGIGLPFRGHIVETGGNANGRWIRFSDGTQICWHTAVYASAELTAGEYTRTWTLPKSFVSPSGYALFVDLSTEPRDRAKGTATGQRAHSRSASSADYYLAIATGFYSAASVELFAIGWWK